jgi:hypothetical protein
MGWKDIPPPKPTPPGEWEAFSYGSNYRGWILRCGPAFNAHITASENKFYTMFNSDGRSVQANLARAQAAVEEEIINSVRVMLPAYRVIFERVEKRGLIKTHANVTPIYGSKEK